MKQNESYLMYQRLIHYTGDLYFLNAIDMAIVNDSNVSREYKMELHSLINLRRQVMLQGG